MTRLNRFRWLPIVALAGIGLSATSGGAAVISVNLHNGGGGDMENTDVAGVVAANNWNNLQEQGTTSVSLTDMSNSSGIATTADLTVLLGSTDTSEGASGATATSNGTAGDRLMMSEGAGNSGGAITLQFRDLPSEYAAAGVRVYLYTWNNTDNPNSGGTNRYGGIYQFEVDADGAGAGDFVDAAFMRNWDKATPGQDWPGFVNEQFAAEDDVTDDSLSSYAVLTITGFDAADGFDIRINNVDEGKNREWLNGVQLEAIPEPSTMALLGLGSLMMLRRRTDG